MTDTAMQTLFGQQVAVAAVRPPAMTRREMLAGIASPALLHSELQGVPKYPQISAAIGGMLVADAIRHPVRNWSLAVTAQVGRFALIEYEPINQSDPDIILPVTAFPPFTEAMLKHQAARERSGLSKPAVWYRRVMKTVRGLVDPLADMQAGPAEAAFVLLWALKNASTGRTTPEQQPRPRRKRKYSEPAMEKIVAEYKEYSWEGDGLAMMEAGL